MSLTHFWTGYRFGFGFGFSLFWGGGTDEIISGLWSDVLLMWAKAWICTALISEHIQINLLTFCWGRE